MSSKKCSCNSTNFDKKKQKRCDEDLIKRILVFINGRNTEHQIVKLEAGRWHHILSLLTLKISPYFGKIEKLYDANTGALVTSFTDLENKGSYVASDCKKFICIKGGYNIENECCKNEYFEHYQEEELQKKNKIKKLAYVRRDLIVIFVFRNGKSQETPAKFVLTQEDLNNWSHTLSYVALVLDIPHRNIKSLYSVNGNRICGPWELQHGAYYVAVSFNEKFKPGCYPGNKSTEQLKTGCSIIPKHKHMACTHKDDSRELNSNTSLPNRRLDLNCKRGSSIIFGRATPKKKSSNMDMKNSNCSRGSRNSRAVGGGGGIYIGIGCHNSNYPKTNSTPTEYSRGGGGIPTGGACCQTNVKIKRSSHSIGAKPSSCSSDKFAKHRQPSIALRSSLDRKFQKACCTVSPKPNALKVNSKNSSTSCTQLSINSSVKEIKQKPGSARTQLLRNPRMYPNKTQCTDTQPSSVSICLTSNRNKYCIKKTGGCSPEKKTKRPCCDGSNSVIQLSIGPSFQKTKINGCGKQVMRYTISAPQNKKQSSPCKKTISDDDSKCSSEKVQYQRSKSPKINYNQLPLPPPVPPCCRLTPIPCPPSHHDQQRQQKSCNDVVNNLECEQNDSEQNRYDQWTYGPERRKNMDQKRHSSYGKNASAGQDDYEAGKPCDVGQNYNNNNHHHRHQESQRHSKHSTNSRKQNVNSPKCSPCNIVSQSTLDSVANSLDQMIAQPQKLPSPPLLPRKSPCCIVRPQQPPRSPTPPMSSRPPPPSSPAPRKSPCCIVRSQQPPRSPTPPMSPRTKSASSNSMGSTSRCSSNSSSKKQPTQHQHRQQKKQQSSTNRPATCTECSKRNSNQQPQKQQSKSCKSAQRQRHSNNSNNQHRHNRQNKSSKAQQSNCSSASASICSSSDKQKSQSKPRSKLCTTHKKRSISISISDCSSNVCKNNNKSGKNKSKPKKSQFSDSIGSPVSGMSCSSKTTKCPTIRPSTRGSRQSTARRNSKPKRDVPKLCLSRCNRNNCTSKRYC